MRYPVKILPLYHRSHRDDIFWIIVVYCEKVSELSFTGQFVDYQIADLYINPPSGCLLGDKINFACLQGADRNAISTASQFIVYYLLDELKRISLDRFFDD